MGTSMYISLLNSKGQILWKCTYRSAHTKPCLSIAIMHACAEEGVLHGDIKEENVPIHRENLRVKLINFGCSSHYTQGFYTHYGGTSVYAPLEWKLIRKYTASGLNVWSLGVLLYAMLNGYIPFNESEYKWELKWITPLSKEARNLIERKLEKKYTERVSLQSVKAHEWMNIN